MPEEKPKPVKRGAEKRKLTAPLQAEVAKCEERLAKLTEMRQKLDIRLADPDLYQESESARMRALQQKDAELKAATEKAEALWLAAVEGLDAAKAG